MYTKKIIYKIVLVMLIFTACQETGIVEVDLPYVEYTVIYGNIEAGRSFDEIFITRTLPLNMAYDSEIAAIPNAIAYLKLNNSSIIPLTHTGEGSYKPFNSIYPEEGETYELFIEIDDSRFYASSTVPEPPVAGRIAKEGDYITIDVVGRTNESYGATWAVTDNYDQVMVQGENLHSLIESTTDNSIVRVRTESIPDEYQTPSGSNLKVILYAFDKDFAKYFNSKSKNRSVENALTQGGTPIYSNIRGENVLGAFTASTLTILNLTN